MTEEQKAKLSDAWEDFNGQSKTLFALGEELIQASRALVLAHADEVTELLKGTMERDTDGAAAIEITIYFHLEKAQAAQVALAEKVKEAMAAFEQAAQRYAAVRAEVYPKGLTPDEA